MANQHDNKQGGGDGRGFAGMEEQKQRDISAKGGASVPDEKRSFSKDHELASEAGRKGGEHSHGGGRSSDKDDRGGRR